MRPTNCRNCGYNEIEEREEGYVCPYCETVYPRLMQQMPEPEPQIDEVDFEESEPYRRSGGKNKWIAFCLCFFWGVFGVHKFYEGRIAQGFLYLLTAGLFGFGWFADMIILLFKPNPYYV